MITNRLFQLSLMMLVLMQSMSAIAQKLPRTLVCYDDIFEPFFMMAGDDFTGINVDLVAEAARRSGIAVTFQKMPFRRLEFELSRGRDSRVDCGFAFSKTAPREKNMLFGQVPIQPTDYTLFVRDESPGITSINDLDGKVIGRAVADQWRRDLAERGKGTGRYGFTVAFEDALVSDNVPVLLACGPEGAISP